MPRKSNLAVSPSLRGGALSVSMSASHSGNMVSPVLGFMSNSFLLFALMLGAPMDADAFSSSKKSKSGGRVGGGSFRKSSPELSRRADTTHAAPGAAAAPATAMAATAAPAVRDTHCLCFSSHLLCDPSSLADKH
eukprot:750679-Hanusia_phi.AAC.4